MNRISMRATPTHSAATAMFVAAQAGARFEVRFEQAAPMQKSIGGEQSTARCARPIRSAQTEACSTAERACAPQGGFDP